MKNTLASLFTLMALSLTATTAQAHPAHLTNEPVHGFLHAEHIILLIAIGVIAYIVKILRS